MKWKFMLLIIGGIILMELVNAGILDIFDKPNEEVKEDNSINLNPYYPNGNYQTYILGDEINWVKEVNINKNKQLEVIAKDIKERSIVVCDFDDNFMEIPKTCKNITYEIPNEINIKDKDNLIKDTIEKQTEELPIIINDISSVDKFYYQITDEEYIKFGENSIVVIEDVSSDATSSTNITDNDYLAHLDISIKEPYNYTAPVSSSLGSELVTNGGFCFGPTCPPWVATTIGIIPWGFSGNAYLSGPPPVNGVLQQDVGVSGSTTYQVIYKFVSNSVDDCVVPYLGGTSLTGRCGPTGGLVQYTQEVTTSNTNNLTFLAYDNYNNGISIAIDDVSVKEIIPASPGKGLSVYYPMDVDIGNVLDYTTRVDGFKRGGIKYAQGVYGNGTCHDGDGDYIEIADRDYLDFTEGANFTISMWFNSTADGTPNHLINKRDLSSPYRAYFCFYEGRTDQGNYHKMVCNLDKGTPQVQIVSTTSIDDGAWHHLALTRKANNLTIYIDGVPEDSDNTAGNNADISNTNSLHIGASRTGANAWNGSIDEVMVFQTALTDAEVREIYNNKSERFKAKGNQLFDVDSFSSGNDYVNITGYTNSLMNSYLNLSVKYYNGTWYDTNPQVFTGNNHFNINSASTDLQLNFTYYAGNITHSFYTPNLWYNLSLNLYSDNCWALKEWGLYVPIDCVYKLDSEEVYDIN